MSGRPAGRTPKLLQRINPEQPTTYADRIIEALTAGAFFDDACAYAGVSKSAAYEWLAKGRDTRAVLEEHDKTPDDLKRNERAYLDFTDSVERAKAGVVVSSLVTIRRAAQEGTWQAAAWYLERTQPSKFGRWQRQDEDGEATVTSDTARAHLLGLDDGSNSDGE
jgi:hypothetical protein